VASNGLEGLAQIKKYPKNFFDIVITDLNMPHMDGKKFIEKMRKLEVENSQNRKIIAILTGNMKEEEMLKNTGMFGADFLMLKPFRIKRFLRFLEITIAKKTGSMSNEGSEKICTKSRKSCS